MALATASAQVRAHQAGSRNVAFKLGTLSRWAISARRWIRIVASQPAPRGLVLPFEQMRKQYGHTAGEFPLFAFAHVFDLVGQVFEVQQCKAPGTQVRRLLIG